MLFSFAFFSESAAVVGVRTRTLKLAGVCILVLVGVLVFLTRGSVLRREPVHNGKPLTAWVEQWQTNHWARWTPDTEQAEHEAQKAIQHIGPAGIPFLLDLMRSRESGFKKKLHASLPRKWHARLHLENRTGKLKMTGALGLGALGTNAQPAVPHLMEMLAAEMVRTPPDHHYGYLPIFTLGFLGSAAEPAIPLLVQCLTNGYAGIHLEAAEKLGHHHLRPDIVVPALTQYLESQRNANGNATRRAAIESIGMFGTNASSAAPVVASFRNDADLHVREAVTNCLLVIEPAAAAKANVRRVW